VSETTERPDSATPATGWFVYGLVPGDTTLDPAARGLGDPPGEVSLVPHGDLGVLMSEVPLDREFGTPEDLVAYKELLDRTAAGAPVIPVHFGTVLGERDGVAQLVDTGHDYYLDLLGQLRGRTEYVVRCRYVEQRLLSEILENNPEAAQLREYVHGQPEGGALEERMRLGEIINQTVEYLRATDTEHLLARMEPVAVAAAPRQPMEEDDGAYVAFLVETAREQEFDQVLEQVAGEWGPRVSIRLIGPLAAYDFVGYQQPAEVG